MAVVLHVPDIHSPYHHPGALDFVTRVSNRVKPDVVVLAGDEADCAAWSKHPKNPDLPGPSDEIEAAAEGLAGFYEAFPKARVCISNHCLRPQKRAAEVGLSERFLRAWREVLGAPPGWEWRDEWVIDNVVYRHGDGFGGKHAMRNAAERMRRSVVIGHLHSLAGVAYLTGPHDTIFGACGGCLIDPTHPAFSYAKYDCSRPVLGCTVIYDGKSASFIPLTP